MSATFCVRPSDVDRDRITVIDVRTPGEFESVHIPGAKNLPLDQLDSHLDTVAEHARDREIILVCRGGARAHQAQEKLVAAGLPELPILEGGMLAWEAEGLDVVVDRMRWDLERQVRFVAGLIVLSAILLSFVWQPAIFIAAFVGAGQIFAAATNTCAMGMLLAKLPYNRPRTSAEPVAG